MADRDDRGSGNFTPSPGTQRLAGAGMEIAVYALVLGGAGYWVDTRIGWGDPYLGIAGVLVGSSLGMYRLIRLAGRMGGS